MSKKKYILSGNYVERVLYRNGALEISQKAKIKFVEELEEVALNISKMAIEIAEKSNKRKTVVDRDIIFALEGGL